MRTRFIRLLSAGLLLMSATLACIISDIGSTANEVRLTAQALATLGGEVVGTVRAFATQQAPYVATAQAFITQQAPLLETAKAVITEQGPQFVGTAQELATQFAIGEAPADIPILSPESAQSLFTSRDVVSYATSLSFVSVVDYYKQAMPQNGWLGLPDEWSETQNAAILAYSKPGRKALLTINVMGNQTVILAIILTQ